jgi:DNA-binding transcriptional LysR family regulator
MDLEVIKTVLTVARLKSFSAAAYVIPCSQSSVSRRVESAESELGVKIFTRPGGQEGRSTELTIAGERIIPVMAKILEDFGELYTVASQPSPDSTSSLNLGLRKNLLAPMGLIMLKADFIEAHENIRIESRYDDIVSLLPDLALGRLDAVLFFCDELDRVEFRHPEDMNITLLGQSSFSVGVSDMNPLSKLRSAHISDLKDEVFLLNDDSSGRLPGIIFANSERFVRRVESMYGFTPKVMKIPDNMLEIRYRLAMENRGVFPCHTPKCWRDLGGITYLHILDPGFSSSYYLLSMKGRKEREVEIFADFFTGRLKEGEGTA